MSDLRYRSLRSKGGDVSWHCTPKAGKKANRNGAGLFGRDNQQLGPVVGAYSGRPYLILRATTRLDSKGLEQQRVPSPHPVMGLGDRPPDVGCSPGTIGISRNVLTFEGTLDLSKVHAAYEGGHREGKVSSGRTIAESGADAEPVKRRHKPRSSLEERTRARLMR